MKTKLSALMTLSTAALLLAACGTTPNTGTYEDRNLLHDRVTSSLTDFKATDPSLNDMMGRAYGYAIFPNVVTAAVGIGGGHGDGEVYQGSRLVGRADISQASIGAQLGGQRFSELILFEDEHSLNEFEHGTVEFDARASAVAASKGAAATANYDKGVIVFTLPQSGLMAQAAIGGQKFRYVDLQGDNRNR
jgi:lipid-binding SYLF domain-containing protein